MTKRALIVGLMLAAASPVMGKLPAYQFPGLVHGNLGLPMRLPSIPFPVSAIGRPAIELPAPRLIPSAPSAIPVLFSSTLQMKATTRAPRAVVAQPPLQGFSLKALNKFFDNAFASPQAR